MAKQALAAKVQTRNEGDEQNTDGPLMDTINVAVKNLIKKGKDRGFLTFGEVFLLWSRGPHTWVASRIWVDIRPRIP